jgi:hypothetical protein
MQGGHCARSAAGDRFETPGVRRETALAGAKTMLSRAFARRSGACLALAALMLQLALSFAHIHKHDLVSSGFERTDVASVGHARSALQAIEQLPSRLADDDDRCQICFSTVLLSNSSLPDAPANRHSLQFAEIDRAFNPVPYRVFQPRHASFLSRAPPAASRLAATCLPQDMSCAARHKTHASPGAVSRPERI